MAGGHIDWSGEMAASSKQSVTPRPDHRSEQAKATPRLRGRKAVAQRKRRLENEPLCRDCKNKGLITVATVPDHIIPLGKGGPDTDDNIRCLCAICHEKRTAEQFGQKYRQPIGSDGWPKA